MALIGGFLNINQAVSGRDEITVGKAGVTAAGSTDAPLLTLNNPDAEDSDGGRESKLLFTGNKADETAHQLGLIQFSHDGSSDDKKGKFNLSLNDGDDADDNLQSYLTIKSDGKAGIGNSSPLVKLHVVGSSGDPTSSGAVASGAAMITGGSASDSGIVMGRMTGVARNWLQVQSASNTAITTNMDLLLQPLYGKVGIGETSPDKLLHLKGDDVDGVLLKVEGNSSYGGTIEYHRGGSYHWRTGVGGTGSTNSNIGSSNFGIEDAADSNTLRFTIAHTTGNAAHTGGRFTTSSKLGVGTTSPDTVLHIENADPYMTFTNTASEDTTGGRESKLIFEGTTVAGGATYDAIQHHLAEIKVSHSGSANDKKGLIEFKVNDGDDSNGSLQTGLTINSDSDVIAGGNLSVGSTVGVRLGYNKYNTDAVGLFGHPDGVTTNSDGNLWIAPRNINSGNGSYIMLGQRSSTDDNAKGNIVIRAGNEGSGDADPSAKMQGNIDINSSAHSGRVYIKGDTGLVGIGHDSPSAKLHVLRSGNKEVARFESTSVTGSRITIESDSGNSSTVGERDGHLVLQDTNARKVAIGFDQPDTLLHMSGADPYMTFTNTAHENSEGGRESKFIFEGSKTDETEHHLAEINVSHYKDADDKKGQFTFKVNDGDDSNGSLQTAVNIDSYKNVVIGGRTSFNGVTGSCAALYAEYTGSAMGTTSHSAPIKSVIDYDNSATAYPPTGYQRPAILISNLDNTNNSFSHIQFAGKSDNTAYPVATIAARNLNTSQAHGMLTFATGGSGGGTHTSKILELRKKQADTWMSIANVKDGTGDNDASDGDGARKSIVKFVGVTQDGGATYDAIEHDLANIVVSHHGTANDKKGKFEILINDGDDADGSLTQAMFIGSDEGHTALGLGAGANLGDSHHNQYNTFIGKNAGVGTNTGDGNVAVGTGTLYYNQKSNFNTAIGYEAAKFLQNSNDNGTTTSNADVDMYNTCIGYSAMATSKQGTNNTIIGANAGYQLKADNNVAIGRSALSAEDYGDSTVAIGNYALNLQNDVTSSSGSNSTTGNVAVGHHAGKHLEEGLDCTFIGSQAGLGSNANRLDGHDNTAIGSQAGYSLITTAAGNTLMGTKAGYLQTTANNNVVIGYNASYYNLTGGASVFVGVEAGKHTRSTTGSNTIVGYKAMQNGHSTYDGNTAHSNTVMGAYAMGENTDDALTSLRNCILGAYAGKEMLSSDDCIAIGYGAGQNLTTGNENTIVGNYAGASLTDNAAQTLYGFKSGQNLVSGAAKNTLIGFYTGINLGHSTSDNNTALGYKALGGGHATQGNNVANNNVAIGMDALGGSTNDSTDLTCINNVVIGVGAGQVMASANTNVLIGMQAGYDLTTGDYNTLIGMQSGHNLIGHSGETYIGYSAGQQIVTGSAQNTFIGYVAGYKLGGNDNDANTSVGYKALAGGSGTYANNTAKNNTAIGANTCGSATTSNFTSSNNVCVGSDAGKTMASGGNTTLVGAFAGDALTTEAGATRIGYKGAIKYITNEVQFTAADSGDNTVIYEVCKIPALSIIHSITAVLVQKSSNLSTYNLNLSLSTSTGTSSDGALANASTTITAPELLGAGAANTYQRNSGVAMGGTAADINAASGATEKTVYYNKPTTTIVGTADTYLYVCNANQPDASNNGTTSSVAVKLEIIIAYQGHD